MSRVAVIHQPDFMPYLGFFHRFLTADLWVVLDNVQFLSGSKSWHNRDKIKAAGGAKWLTVSVKKCPRETSINEVVLSDAVGWRDNNLNQIEFNYKKAPFYREIFPHLAELYDYRTGQLLAFNLKSINMLMELLDVRVDMVLASELAPKGRSNALLVDILKKVDASAYLSGVGAKDYFDPAPFDEAGIEVRWQGFEHPVYPQLFGDFIPCLSSIDLLFNCGIEKSRELLRSCK